MSDDSTHLDCTVSNGDIREPATDHLRAATGPHCTPDAYAAIERAATWIELGDLGGTPGALALVATLRSFTRTPRPATVGALLATAQHNDIIECRIGSTWWQVGSDGGVRWRDGARWSPWHESVIMLMKVVGCRGRLVPPGQHDASPLSRGPIGEG